MSQILSKFSAKLTASNIAKVESVCSILEINPNWLLAVMFFETAGTLSPAKRNKIGSAGLIQFTRDRAGVNYKTVAGKKYDLDKIAQMTFNDQMDLVQAYYNEVLRAVKTKMTSFIDVYLVTFFPNAIGKDDDYVFQTAHLSKGIIAKQNPVFAKNGVVKKKNVTDHFAKYYGSLFEEIKKKI